MGDGTIEEILAARVRSGIFSSLQQLCREVDSRSLNRKALESLIKSGALDCFGLPRAFLFGALDSVVSSVQKESRDLAAGQASLFGGADSHASQSGPAFAPERDWSSRERLAYEKETLGFYFSGHPLREHGAALASLGNLTTRNLTPDVSGKGVSLGGLVTALKKRKTRRGDWMAVFALEDLEGTVEVVVFPELYKICRDRLEDEAPVVVRGKAELEDGSWRLVAEEVSALAGAAERRASQVVLEINTLGMVRESVHEIQRLLRHHPGDCPVLLRLSQPGAYRLALRPDDSIRVRPTADLTRALEQLLGKGKVSYR